MMADAAASVKSGGLINLLSGGSQPVKKVKASEGFAQVFGG